MLLDEIEKAHPDVFNVLLQVLDDGRLTDGQGRTVELLQRGADHDVQPSAATSARRSSPSSSTGSTRSSASGPSPRTTSAQIVDIQLRGLDRRLADRRLGLVVTDAAKAWLAHRGYDPVYGARPLKRLIQRQISDRLALALLEGRYPEGSTVTVDVGPSCWAAPISSRPTSWYCGNWGNGRARRGLRSLLAGPKGRAIDVTLACPPPATAVRARST